ncbi:MAG: uracil-DNA glycosylase family protein [Myxococcales bacterium]|nr:uracil-DNA glycosylase family protein [Myxococcales bacterium]
MSERAVLQLIKEIRGCRVCAEVLPLEPRPILAARASARILIAGQAPGREVHLSGVPWRDASGDRLREWLGIEVERFYDPAQVALVPTGFCYPGSGRNGDLPPRPECRGLWHPRLLPLLESVELTILVGEHAQRHHLGDQYRGSVTATVQAWSSFTGIIPLPHPSPRNRGWLRRNPYFAEELLPQVRARIARLLG